MTFDTDVFLFAIRTFHLLNDMRVQRPIFVISLFVVTSAVEEDLRLGLTAALLKSSPRPNCKLWTTGNLTHDHMNALHDILDQDLITLGLPKILANMCLPCLTVLARYWSPLELDRITMTQNILLKKRAYVPNPCRKFPFSAFQVVLLEGPANKDALLKKKLPYTTHFLSILKDEVAQVCTVCANGQRGSCVAWREGLRYKKI